MRQRTWTYCGISLVLWLTACLDQVDLPLPSNDPPSLLIVEGMITQGAGPHRVSISSTTSLGGRNNQPVQVSAIWIENRQGVRADLDQTGAGTYALASQSMPGIAGETYRLHFTLPDGREYASDPELLPAGSRLDSVYYEVAFDERYNQRGRLIGRNFMDIYADVRLRALPESPYIRWVVDRWWLVNEFIRPSPPSKACYVQDPLLNPNQILLFDGREVRSEYWRKQPLGSVELDYKFYEKTYLNVYQYSLSPAAFAYWQKVEKVLNQNGDIFDSPPAAIAGNVHNVDAPYEQVLGYFGASTVDTIHFPVFRQDLPVRVDWLCNVQQTNNLYSSHPCFDCLVIPRSTAERPDYW